mgnify:CR=1 FL=1
MRKNKVWGFLVVLFVVCAFLVGCASAPLVLHKAGPNERGRIATLYRNNSHKNSYQVIIKSVDGVAVEGVNRIEVEEGEHSIRYEILDNYSTERGTDFKFSSRGTGEVRLDLKGGKSYVIGTFERSNHVGILFVFPSKR